MATLNNTRICFIGAGNMATALAGGLIAKGVDAKNISMSDVSETLLLQHEKNMGVRIHLDNSDAIKDADAVILAVKPQVMDQVISPIADQLKQQGTLIISIAAGVTLEKYATWLGEQHPVIRCMPNTAALIGTGATGLAVSDSVNENHKEIADAILHSAGIVEWFDDEKLLDAVTALSGSGPAYFFLVMDALIQSGIKMGLSPESSKNLTLQTALGAAQMAIMSDESLEELRLKVTSPGGTTEAAVNSLQQDKLEAIFEKALAKAHDRSIELG